MRKLKTKTTTYSVDNNFNIDIVYNPNSKVYEAWIYLKNYGFKMFMFGYCAKNIDEFLELVKGNFYQYAYMYIQQKDEMEEYSIEKDL